MTKRIILSLTYGKVFASPNAMGRRIQRLSPQVANQVAAGEVVERPASVVKELLENSLDAEATRIEVRFHRAGKDFISVCDNGAGMNRRDALLCLERHTTSKIHYMEDLRRVTSFGFRGEALAAIGSVSQLTMRTRCANDAMGTEILMDDGVVKNVANCACQTGTQMYVAMLFKSIPARRKFLKSDQTESHHIVEIVRIFATIFPAVQFSLWNEEKTIFHLHEQPFIDLRIGELWGEDVLRGLIPLDYVHEKWRIHGWICNGRSVEQCMGEMLFFVNHRHISSKELKEWILDAYGKFLPYARSLPCFLFLEIPPEEIDVNVHPTKKEVRFSQRRALRAFIVEAIGKALKNFHGIVSIANNVREIRSAATGNAFPFLLKNTDVPEEKIYPPDAAATEMACENVLKSPEKFFSVPTKMDSATAKFNVVSPENLPSEAVAKNYEFSEWQFLGKFNERSVLFKTESGIIFFDIRRAACRVSYEHILSSIGNQREQQLLLIPLTLDLRRKDIEISTEMLEELRCIGFRLEEKAAQLYEISALPIWMKESSGEAFLYDWFLWKRAHLRELQMELLAKTAAAHVAAARQWNGEREILQLLNDLMACDVIHHSPEGKAIY
ncbi:MAG: DNA mismatch repair endonuclease MutL, partial [Puniceicoccales bacterium]|nr:DNA mismatch repair endonuclease MutL [Puniceicoccales bacterium]